MEKKTSILREPPLHDVMQEIWNDHSGDPYHGGKFCICLMRLPDFFPRPLTCVRYIESKTNRGPSREGPLWQASLRPQLFCEFYLQPSPSIAQRPLGSSRSYFFRHISTAVISNALPFFSLMRASIFRCYDLSRSMPNRVPD